MDNDDALEMFEQEYGRVLLTREEFDEIDNNLAQLRSELNDLKSQLIAQGLRSLQAH